MADATPDPPLDPTAGSPSPVSPPSAAAEDLDALRARRATLVERLDAIRADLGRGLDRDSGERAVELENAEVLDEIARVASEELAALDERIAAARSARRRG